ncbi:MAG: CoA transferase [Porticoccaceae bacterium]|nr:CoA transferase [Porticoccaceae bacterium]
MAVKHVLDGIKVLDFTQYLAGPTTTRLMAEMGAEIIKVEWGPHGDPVRGVGYIKDKRSAYYIQQNRGKQSLCLDFSKPEANEIIKEIVPHMDIIMENFSPGVIGRLGLDWETVHALNPEAIMCSLSAFGQTGPLAKLPGFDYIAQAYSGVTSMIGEADGPAYLPMLGLGDVNTGVHALAAINAALFHRERGHGGQYLDISLLDSYFHCHEINVQMYSASDGNIEPSRSGQHHFAVAPLGLFKGKTSQIVIIAMITQWKNLCNAMGKPELADDPKFKDIRVRVENRFELVKIIEDWLASMPSDEESIRVLEEHRVPVAPMLTVPQAMAHPHLKERNTVRTVSDRTFGEVEIPGVPLRFSQFPDFLPLEAPFLGEHNDNVLGEMLGYSDDKIAGLAEQGVLISRTNN